MKNILKTTLAISAMAVAAQVAAQVTFYENDNFEGRSFTTQNEVRNFDRTGFNDRASSVIVFGERQEVCEDSQFRGRCVVLRAGRYPSLSAMGLNDRVSSVRTVDRNARVDDNRYAPPPMPVYDNRRRNNERVFEADVTSVRAVVGPPQQRCWMEKEEVQGRGNANIGGAVVGALLGGVLGHQIGGGRGQDIATAGGAVAGAAVGANVGRNGQTTTQDVQRCATEPASTRPEYWDVTYNFRGQEHRIQMTTPPGRTVTVNRRGEPRA
nr:beta/gamma crystallin-related protein [uncultured Albidiferax sp.]